MDKWTHQTYVTPNMTPDMMTDMKPDMTLDMMPYMKPDMTLEMTLLNDG